MTDPGATGRVQGEILRILTAELDLVVPGPDTDLLETGTLDSLKFVSLLHQLEVAFQIQFAIDDLDMETFRSVRQIADLVTRRTERERRNQ